jgi:S-adenosylmethionine hydrolase
MIGLLTDFGTRDPYLGQMHAVLAQEAPDVPVVDLWHSLPNFDARAGAYLLPAYARGLPPGSVYVCVVDPGVGSSRPAVALELDGDWYVGPDNGLFAVLWRRARTRQCHVIDWRPAEMSASFHGRDLFAPVAALLARGQHPAMHEAKLKAHGDAWPEELQEVVYIDHYGNAITGMRAAAIKQKGSLQLANRLVPHAETFSDAPREQAFWYENSNGLVEIAVNSGCAEQGLGLHLGDEFAVIPSES